MPASAGGRCPARRPVREGLGYRGDPAFRQQNEPVLRACGRERMPCSLQLSAHPFDLPGRIRCVAIASKSWPSISPSGGDSRIGRVCGYRFRLDCCSCRLL